MPYPSPADHGFDYVDPVKDDAARSEFAEAFARSVRDALQANVLADIRRRWCPSADAEAARVESGWATWA